MDIYLPSIIVKTTADKLQKKIIRSKIVKGIYKGYNLSEDIIVSLSEGHDGWNIFINPNSEHTLEALDFIIKNKRSILFIMNDVDTHNINLKMKQ